MSKNILIFVIAVGVLITATSLILALHPLGRRLLIRMKLVLSTSYQKIRDVFLRGKSLVIGPHRSRAARILFAIVINVLFFITIEGIVRLGGWSKSRPDEIYTDIYDPTYELKPGAVNPYANDRDIINKRGFRGEPVPVDRTPGSFRFACVGDSSTFGIGVETKETYCEQLGESLRQHFPGRKIDWINAGLPGSTLYQQTWMIRRRLLPFSPDLYILYSGADMECPDRVIQELESRETHPQRVRQMLRKSAVYRLMRRFIKGGPEKAPFSQHPDVLRLLASDDPVHRDLVKTCTEHEVAALLETVPDRKKLLWVNLVDTFNIHRMIDENIQPGTEKYRDYLVYHSNGTMVRDVLLREGVACIDLFPAFLSAGDPAAYFVDPVHPNPAGHLIITRVIENEIFKLGLVQ